MKIEQEPKYAAVDGVLVNRATGKAIPDDEPVFVLRAKDVHAVYALRAYLEACYIVPNDEHIDAVLRRIAEFENFSNEHGERMKLPYTDRALQRR